jgi:hypothetical protein
MITAEGEIKNFFSWTQNIAEQGKKWVSEYYKSLGYVGEGGIFNPIDIDKLIERAKEGISNNNIITSYSISPDYFDTDNNGSSIWYYDASINPFINSLTITPGTFNEGRKTIIVENGDLILQPNIVYKTSAIGFSNADLPSVAFIVRNGNVKIRSTQEDPNDGAGEGENIVGNFYVDGDGTDTGIIYTRCSGQICSSPLDTELNRDKHLVVEGLMVARKLEFQRSTSLESWTANKGDVTVIDSYSAGNAPSEVVWYDNRVNINTPKGFEDLAKALPKWEE